MLNQLVSILLANSAQLTGHLIGEEIYAFSVLLQNLRFLGQNVGKSKFFVRLEFVLSGDQLNHAAFSLILPLTDVLFPQLCLLLFKFLFSFFKFGQLLLPERDNLEHRLMLLLVVFHGFCAVDLHKFARILQSERLACENLTQLPE
jgi:hypothetical protein